MASYFASTHHRIRASESNSGALSHALADVDLGQVGLLKVGTPKGTMSSSGSRRHHRLHD